MKDLLNLHSRFKRNGMKIYKKSRSTYNFHTSDTSSLNLIVVVPIRSTNYLGSSLLNMSNEIFKNVKIMIHIVQDDFNTKK